MAGVAERGDVRGKGLDIFEADVALGQFADDDFVKGGDFVMVRGRELDFVLFEEDFGIAALEIKAVGQFLFGLVDGVLNFHGTDFRYDVE